MNEVTVKIIPHTERPMTFNNEQPGFDAKNLQIGIIQHGTEQGQTVVALCMETQEGKNIIYEITANQFIMLVGAFNGAQKRFAEIKNSN